MPQIQTIDLSPNPRNEATALEKTIAGFTKRNREIQVERQEGDSLTKLYEQHKNDGDNLESLIRSVNTNPSLSPSKKVAEMERLKNFRDYNMKLQEESRKKVEAENKKANQMQIIRDREKAMNVPEGTYNHYQDNLGMIPKPAKASTTKPEPLSPFERTLQNEEAKKVVKLEEEIPKAKDALANLDRIDELAKNELSGVTGFAKAIFNTESAKEMENLSFTAIEPIIKLFNPVGPIPVAKVNIIRQQFQAHPGDLLTTIRGKNAALRRIGEQGLARAQERIKLIYEHNGKVPPEKLQEFDSQSSQLIDVLTDQESFNIKLKDAGENGNITGLYSKDGRPLKPMPAKKAKELYEQGLITNVPTK